LLTAGQFRDDLYYRLSAVQILLPSLAHRREDIPLLAAAQLDKLAAKSGQRLVLAPEATELLVTADWPGNIPQLFGLLTQIHATATGPVISAETIQRALGSPEARVSAFDEARDEFTRSYLTQLLQLTKGNVSQAARLARRNRTDFYKLLSKHEVRPEDFKLP
jgi:two-component system, NtrC family, response regulator GlrR